MVEEPLCLAQNVRGSEPALWLVAHCKSVKMCDTLKMDALQVAQPHLLTVPSYL